MKSPCLNIRKLIFVSLTQLQKYATIKGSPKEISLGNSALWNTLSYALGILTKGSEIPNPWILRYYKICYTLLTTFSISLHKFKVMAIGW